MNAITKTEGGVLALSEADLCNVLQTSLYPGAAIQSIKMVIAYCKAAKLDPMQKPVHIVPMWSQKEGRMVDVIMPGINLYRTQAMRSGECAGVSEPEFGPEVTENIGGQQVTFPAWCRVTTKRRLPTGEIVGFTAREFWKENYATKGGKEKSIAPNAMWTKRVYGQIAKCAQAQSLRLAFPELASAPTAEEMEGKAVAYEEPAPVQADYVDPALFMDGIADCKTDAEALQWWRDHNAKLAKQPDDHAAFKAAVAAHRSKLRDASVTDVQPKSAPAAKSFEEVMDMLTSAKTIDALYVAGDWIGQVNDPEDRATLAGKFDEMKSVLESQS